jgi:hypothetical protein
MINSNTNFVDKIDVEDLIKDFRITKIDEFLSYLKDVWRVNIYFFI